MDGIQTARRVKILVRFTSVSVSRSEE